MNINNIPKTGLAGLKAHIKDDLVSGFSVSLIALPLCLGIAIASGVPPLAGLITAIVGGIIGSRVAGSFVTISGPAAGLIVITLGAAESMGGAGIENGFAGYPHALGAILIGGVIMALFGLLKIGKVGDYFPSAAVHGMLAAIGVIIIIKQIFPALGVAAPSGEILEVATEIPHAFTELNPYAGAIALVTILILAFHPMIKSRIIQLIPAPMWVMIVTIPMAMILGAEHLALVDMPDKILGEGGIAFPSFEKIGEGAFWIAVVGVALVSAIESLLSAKAVDTLDPYKRKSNLDRDLLAMGGGSALAATIGGLPMISEIVRSSANVNNGAKTQWANFFHGAFLLVFLLAASSIIEMIPIAALAAMLVYTGFKLAAPKEFKHMYQIGLMELEIFIVTLIAVLATDLIIGIGIGILFKYILIAFKGAKVKEFFKSNLSIENRNDQSIIHLVGAQIFSNYLSLKKRLDLTSQNTDALVLDFENASMIDHTVMDHLEEYARDMRQNGKELSYINIENLNPVSSHPLAGRSKQARYVYHPHISKRAQAMIALAENLGGEFTLRQKFKTQSRFPYPIFLGKKITSIENIIRLEKIQAKIILADIHLEKGAEITAESEQMTVLEIIDLGFDIPDFSLRKEDWIDHLFKNWQDIDLESFPDFSKQFFLKGEDEKAIRQFFQANIIEWMKKHSDYQIETNDNRILIAQSLNFIKEEDLNSFIKVGEELSQLVSRMYVQKSTPVRE